MTAPGGDDVQGRLLGRWRLLRADAGVDLAPDSLLDFRPSGQLQYTIEVEGSVHTFALVWRVNGDLLETASLADGHAMIARIGIGEADVLLLDFSGGRAWFLREL